jgi:hypothetical protein
MVGGFVNTGQGTHHELVLVVVVVVVVLLLLLPLLLLLLLLHIHFRIQIRNHAQPISRPLLLLRRREDRWPASGPDSKQQHDARVHFIYTHPRSFPVC